MIYCFPDSYTAVGRTRRPVMALGCFDGLHTGHMKLLESVTELAGLLGARPAVCLIEGDRTKPRLTPDAERPALFAAAGIELVAVEDLDRIRGMSPESFITDRLIEKYGCVGCVCGYNFRFGAGREGNTDTLLRICREHGLAVAVTGEHREDGETVSSTRIRELLIGGESERAAVLLGRPYTLTAMVLHGNRLGSRIGVPTLNQCFTHDRVIPKNGVYVSTCEIDGRLWRSVTNVGRRPTLEIPELSGYEHGSTVCETHIPGFEGELYGRTVTVGFLKRLRDERRFGSAAELKAAISADIQAAIGYASTDGAL